MAYWVTLAAFWWFTYFFGFILNLVPMMLCRRMQPNLTYLKCGALVYLYCPFTRGVDKVVDAVFKPYVFPQVFGVPYVKKATAQESNGAPTNSEATFHGGADNAVAPDNLAALD
ncbi:unnamed protein product [Prorocentrum cordatum]|nr:unnamed protein product [Polarella glacialis]